MPVRHNRQRVRLTVEYRSRQSFMAARICRESGLKGVPQKSDNQA